MGKTSNLYYPLASIIPLLLTSGVKITKSIKSLLLWAKAILLRNATRNILVSVY